MERNDSVFKDQELSIHLEGELRKIILVVEKILIKF